MRGRLNFGNFEYDALPLIIDVQAGKSLGPLKWENPSYPSWPVGSGRQHADLSADQRLDIGALAAIAE